MTAAQPDVQDLIAEDLRPSCECPCECGRTAEWLGSGTCPRCGRGSLPRAEEHMLACSRCKGNLETAVLEVYISNAKLGCYGCTYPFPSARDVVAWSLL